MDKFWENYIKTRPSDSKGAFDAFKKMNQEPRTGFKDGNGVYDEKELLGKRVNELMDEGYDFGEAVKQAMKEGYAKGGRIGFSAGTLVAPVLTYPFTLGLAQILGVATAGVGATELSGVVANKIKENPEVLETPQAKAIMMSLGITPTNLFKKPKDESKKEIVGRIESIKKEPDQEPPEDPFDPNKLLEVLESTTYNIAETRLKNKAMNYLEKKINERAQQLINLDPKERRKTLNKEFKKLLGNQVSVNAVQKKDGSILYDWANPDGTSVQSKNLIEVLNKRNDVQFKKEQPFRKKGLIKRHELEALLKNKGLDESSLKYLQKASGAFADVNKIKRVKAKHSDWFENPTDEKLQWIVNQYSSIPTRVERAKELIEEYGLQSHTQIINALNKEGYPNLSSKDMNKYFPEYRKQFWADKDFVSSRTPRAVIENIRKTMIKNYGSPTMEKFLVSTKHKLGFGKEVELMHPQQKEKPSGALYNFGDLVFGSAEENEAYSEGLDKMRSDLTNALKVIKYDYEGKDLNQKIKVPFHLQEKFDFPKTMTVRKYVDRLNYMLTDLSTLTGGKVRGELLDIVGKKMKFVENRVGIDWSLVPGKGLLEGQLKKYEGLFKKFKLEMKLDSETGKLKSTGRLEIGEDGYPVLKEGKKLTQNQAEILMTIVEGLTEQLVSAKGSEPKSLETVKEVFKKIPKASGGRIGYGGGYLVGGAKKLFDKSIPKDKYSRQMMGLISGEEGIYEILSLLNQMGLFADGGRAGYMGGGITAIRKPHAIPPERQGLRSIMINGKKS